LLVQRLGEAHQKVALGLGVFTFFRQHLEEMLGEFSLFLADAVLHIAPQPVSTGEQLRVTSERRACHQGDLGEHHACQLDLEQAEALNIAAEAFA